MSCENCANAYDEGYTAGHNAENARLREAIGLATTAVPTMEMDAADPVGMMQRVVAEIDTLREQVEALEAAHQRVRSIILSVENRCMAADGPVSRTLEEMTEDELRAIWQASDAALRAYQEATP